MPNSSETTKLEALPVQSGAAPSASGAAPAVLLVLGVSGSGKTRVGSLLAARLGWTFRDGDTFHPIANVEKMACGVPLDDADRWPWLDAIAAWIDGVRQGGGHAVVACSALKRVYRARLLDGDPARTHDILMIYLKGSFEMIAARLAARRGHFMPPSLLKSQFEALEPPGADEAAIAVSIEPPADRIVDAIVRRLGALYPACLKGTP